MLNIYKASAGSGKTYTLAFEYIRMLLGTHDSASGSYRLNLNPREAHRHILAITFTVKATEEMKNRILHELAVLAGREPDWHEPSPYIDDLVRLYRCSPQQIAQAADLALNSILFDFNYFSISTIDSFFQMVLRTFAHEAELSGNYEIELDNKVAIDYGVNRMISNFNHEASADKASRRSHRQLGDWIYRFMESKINEGKTFNLFNRASGVHASLINFIRDVSDDDFMEAYEALMEYLKDPERITRFTEELARRHNGFIDTARDAATEALNYLTANNLGEKGSGWLINHYVPSTLRNMIAANYKSPGATATKVVADYEKNFLSAAGRKAGLAADGTLRDLALKAMQSYVDVVDNCVMLKNVSANLFVLGLLGRVYDNIEQFRVDNDMILLSDTGTLLSSIIGNDDAPFVYERIGQWYDHFLIDEFQDTSQVQWKNLKPLVAESLSDLNDNLVIGDEKQCIYRFRDSDPRLLHDLHHQFPDRSEPLNDSLEGNTNWRSSVEVVQFNNTVFHLMGRQLGQGLVYDSVVQPIASKNAGKHGYVKATLIDGDSKKGATRFKEVVLSQLIYDVKLAFAQGYRPVDIAILVRTRRQGQDVINTLIEHKQEFGRPNLRVVSDDSMGIAGSPAVRLIISILRYLSSHNEPSSKRHISSRRVAALINRFEYFMSVGLNEGEAITAALEIVSNSTENSLADEVTDEVAAMTCLTLPSLIERIIARFIDPSTAETQNLYITAFQDLVIDYSERFGSDLRSFLNWWDTIGCDYLVSGAQDSEAIRVMTIHKSKGLEFRWVIVPFVSKTVPDFQSPEWFEPAGFEWIEDKTIIPPLLPITPAKWMSTGPFAKAYLERCNDLLLDELNVIYVAFTRAVDALVVYAYKNGNSMGRYLAEAIASATPGAVAEWTPARAPLKPLAVEPVIPLSDKLLPYAGLPEPEGEPPLLKDVERLVIGEPPSFMENQKPLTALQPRLSRDMMPYVSSDRADIWADTRLDDSRHLSEAGERGILIHDILSATRHRNDLPKAVRTMVQRGAVEETEAAGILQFLSSRLEREDVAHWFEGFTRVLTERNIENIRIEDKTTWRRPDRVVWTPDRGVIVIDYKTGEKQLNTHKTQVVEYINLLKSMGFDNVTGYLWYLSTDTIVAVQ